jgi:hypothetical protein
VAAEQERFEAWIIDEVKAGAALPGLYPPNAETKARYEAFRKDHAKAAKSRAISGTKPRTERR